MKKSYNFKRRNLWSGPHLLGSLLIFAGFFTFLSPLIFDTHNSVVKIVGVGLAALIPGLAIVTSYGGVIIDYAENRYKEYISWCGFKSGHWTSIPDIHSVKLVSTRSQNTNVPNGISPTFSGMVNGYKALIFTGASEPLFSFVYSNRDKAILHARNLASNLNVDLKINIPEDDS